ncbi:uncharacterized protein [Temnothorax nylanderi]|uniref:uncharacterized protein n=1 Tax=Temnothorax nylanderi TaxID=102681 RepID=UPI003A8AB2CA
MAFVGVEFANDLDEQESGAIALVHCTWLTPRKKEVWWPPYKTSARFKKALSVGEEPKEDAWKLCYVQRIFFSYDDLDKANKKLKKCEEFSDVQSSALEDINQIKKRQRKRNSKYERTSSESESNEDDIFHPPPKISKTLHNKSSNKSVTPQFTSSNIIQKDCLSQQVTHSNSVVSTCSTSTKTSDATDSSRQTVLPLDQTVTPALSPITVPRNIKTLSQSSNSSHNYQSSSSYKGSHSHTFAGMYLNRSIKLKNIFFFYITDIYITLL